MEVAFPCVLRLTAHKTQTALFAPMALRFSDATQLVFHHVSGRPPASQSARKRRKAEKKQQRISLRQKGRKFPKCEKWLPPPVSLCTFPTLGHCPFPSLHAFAVPYLPFEPPVAMQNGYQAFP